MVCPLAFEIRKYKMLGTLCKFHKKKLKAVRAIRPKGTFEATHKEKNLKREQGRIKKLNDRIRKMRKAIYYDPNTFEDEL